MGLMGHLRVIILIVTYCRGFVLSKTESLWHILVCESLLALKFTFINNCPGIHTFMAGNKLLYQNNSNKTRHLRFESGKTGRLPVLRKE